MKLEFDDDGTLSKPNLHDGLLVGLHLASNNSLCLICRGTDQAEWRVTIPKIVRLRADNFRQGNIIFGIRVLSAATCSEETMRRLEEYSAADDATGPTVALENARKNRWSMLELGSSYGCELLALFEGNENNLTAERVTT